MCCLNTLSMCYCRRKFSGNAPPCLQCFTMLTMVSFLSFSQEEYLTPHTWQWNLQQTLVGGCDCQRLFPLTPLLPKSIYFDMYASDLLSLDFDA